MGDSLECICGAEGVNACDNCGSPACEKCLIDHARQWCRDCIADCTGCGFEPCMCSDLP